MEGSNLPCRESSLRWSTTGGLACNKVQYSTLDKLDSISPFIIQPAMDTNSPDNRKTIPSGWRYMRHAAVPFIS